MTNSSTKTNAREALYAALKTINESNITLDMLKTATYDKLYNDLFANLEEYINMAIWFDENKNMTTSLIRKGKKLDNIQAELLSSLFLKFDKVLSKATVDHQLYYIKSTIHTELCDYFKLRKIDRDTVSLNELQFNSSDDDKDVTREDCFADFSHSPEYILFEEPAIKEECIRKLKERRQELVLTVDILKDKRHQLLALLAIDALNIKCNKITDALINAKNINTVEADVLKSVGRRYGIMNEISKIISTSKTPLLRSSFKLDTKTDTKELSKIVAAEVSRLKNRGKTAVKTKIKK